MNMNLMLLRKKDRTSAVMQTCCWFVETLCRTVDADWCKVPSLGIHSLTSTALSSYLLLAGEPFPFAIEPLLSGCTGPNPDSPLPGSRAAAALLNEGVL
jgi:hypothetical protein